MAFEKEFENLFRSFAESKERQDRTSDLIDKLSLEQAKTDKQIKKLSKELGNISNNNGVVA